MDPGLFDAVLIQSLLQVLWVFLSADAELEVLVIRDEDESDSGDDEVGEAFSEVHWLLWRLFGLLLFVLGLLGEVESLVARHAVLVGLLEALLLPLKLLPFRLLWTHLRRGLWLGLLGLLAGLAYLLAWLLFLPLLGLDFPEDCRLRLGWV